MLRILATNEFDFEGGGTDAFYPSFALLDSTRYSFSQARGDLFPAVFSDSEDVLVSGGLNSTLVGTTTENAARSKNKREAVDKNP